MFLAIGANRFFGAFLLFADGSASLFMFDAFFGAVKLHTDGFHLLLRTLTCGRVVHLTLAVHNFCHSFFNTGLYFCFLTELAILFKGAFPLATSTTASFFGFDKFDGCNFWGCLGRVDDFSGRFFTRFTPAFLSACVRVTFCLTDLEICKALVSFAAAFRVVASVASTFRHLSKTFVIASSGLALGMACMTAFFAPLISAALVTFETSSTSRSCYLMGFWWCNRLYHSWFYFMMYWFYNMFHGGF
jgi:hypothetical protein